MPLYNYCVEERIIRFKYINRDSLRGGNEMENAFIKEEKIQLGSIPAILYGPREKDGEDLLPTIITVGVRIRNHRSLEVFA